MNLEKIIKEAVGEVVGEDKKKVLPYNCPYCGYDLTKHFFGNIYLLVSCEGRVGKLKSTKPIYVYYSRKFGITGEDIKNSYLEEVNCPGCKKELDPEPFNKLLNE